MGCTKLGSGTCVVAEQARVRAGAAAFVRGVCCTHRGDFKRWFPSGSTWIDDQELASTSGLWVSATGHAQLAACATMG